MTRRRYVAYRVCWALVATVIVVSVLFLVVSLVPDYTALQEIRDVSRSGIDADERAALEEELLDTRPLHERYVDWMTSVFTFDWGSSERFDAPVTDLLVHSAPITLAYVVPAVVLSAGGAVVLGYVAARRRQEAPDFAITGSAYLLLSLPNFVLAAFIVRYVERAVPPWIPQSYNAEAGVYAAGNRLWLAFAALVLGTHLLATQLRHVRVQSGEYLPRMFVKLARAKGVSRLRVAQHVLRAATVPIMTLVVADVAGLLLVSVFVIEAVFGIPGLGYVTWQAAVDGDRAVILVVTMLIAVTIILANLLEDVVSVAVDPRVGGE